MKTSFDKIDVIFEYKGLWDVESKCGLEIFEKGSKTIVVVTELYQDNPGTSVTEAATLLVRQICERYSVDPLNMIYIEHNPITKSKLDFYDEAFFFVNFVVNNGEFSNPSWKKLEEEDIRRIFE